MKLRQGDILGLQYKVNKKIGAGSFGEIYQANDVITNQEVAIKTESKHCRFPQILYEAKAIKLISCNRQTHGIPFVHTYGTDGDYNYMVIDILGPSLEDMFNYCGRQFSLKTTLMLITQLVERFEYLHSKSFIHRDIKPDNFLMGLKDNSSTVYVVDYGLAKRFQDPRTQQHIPYRNDKSLTGTARYASIHAHLNEELARRDDMEAVGIVMLYFYKGQLPWQNLPAFSKSDKYRRIKEKKVATKLEDLCTGCPDQILKYMLYCRDLAFQQKPKYTYLLQLLNGLAQQEGFDLEDKVFDWVIKHHQLGRGIEYKPDYEEDQEEQKGEEMAEFQFKSYADAHKMIRGVQLRNQLMEMEMQNKANNDEKQQQQQEPAHQANVQNVFRHEVQALKNDIGFIIKKGKQVPNKEQQPNRVEVGKSVYTDTVKQINGQQVAGPQLSLDCRLKFGMIKAKEQQKQSGDGDSSQGDREIGDESFKRVMNKSMMAHESKFYQDPVKKRVKVIIMDDDELKMGGGSSVNPGLSMGSNQIGSQKVKQLNSIDGNQAVDKIIEAEGEEEEKEAVVN